MYLVPFMYFIFQKLDFVSSFILFYIGGAGDLASGYN